MYTKTSFSVSSLPQCRSQVVVCISTPRMYPRSRYFLVNPIFSSLLPLSNPSRLLLSFTWISSLRILRPPCQMPTVFQTELPYKSRWPLTNFIIYKQIVWATTYSRKQNQYEISNNSLPFGSPSCHGLCYCNCGWYFGRCCNFAWRKIVGSKGEWNSFIEVNLHRFVSYLSELVI